MEINHDQLKNGAARAFTDIGADLAIAVQRAVDDLAALGAWSVEEEADRAFCEWFMPKAREMTTFCGGLSTVYSDVAGGVLAMRNNVATVDWGVADDMRALDIPIYELPE